MSKTRYKIDVDASSPQIDPTHTDEGMTWGEAKKYVRDWYLERIKQLRHVTEKSYFDDDPW